MRLVDLGQRESLFLGAALLVVSALLALGQWRDRRRRPALRLSPPDAEHYGRQDVRRWLGSAVMALLAAVLVVGTRIDFRVERLRRLFYGVWLLGAALIVALLVLALLDWLATRRFAQRHLRDIAAERNAVIAEHRRLRESRRRAGPGRGFE